MAECYFSIPYIINTDCILVFTERYNYTDQSCINSLQYRSVTTQSALKCLLYPEQQTWLTSLIFLRSSYYICCPISHFVPVVNEMLGYSECTVLTVRSWWVWDYVTDQVWHLSHLRGFTACSTLQITLKADSHIACRTHAFPCHAVR